MAEEQRRYKDCHLGVCGNMCTGNASTVASDVSAEHPGDISRQGADRHYICVVGFSTLRFRVLHRLVMDELWSKIIFQSGGIRDITLIEIKNGIFISDDDLVFKASRSSGPGGQNVNKVSTRVTLFFDVAGCDCFSDGQKTRILERLKTRADKDGVIRVVSQRYRTQKANRDAARERLVELLRGALARKPVRKKTKVPKAQKERRLEEKKRRGLLKQQRMMQKGFGIDY